MMNTYFIRTPGLFLKILDSDTDKCHVNDDLY